MSSFQYYQEAQGGKEPTDENIVGASRGLTPTGVGGFQFSYLYLRKLEKFSALSSNRVARVKNPSGLVQRVSELIRDYDMLVLNERMDESLVAFALLAGE
jgi:hypothetical protein